MCPPVFAFYPFDQKTGTVFPIISQTPVASQV
jgi:hypothetical protein